MPRCVNGTSPGGWYDVMAMAAAGVEYSSPSTADLVRPKGALMVASGWAKALAGNFSNVKIVSWTLERSKAVYAQSPAVPNNWQQGLYFVFDSAGWAYQQHGGVSALDYEDMVRGGFAAQAQAGGRLGRHADGQAGSSGSLGTLRCLQHGTWLRCD